MGRKAKMERFVVEVKAKTKKAFTTTCKKKGVTPSAVLRGFIEANSEAKK